MSNLYSPGIFRQRALSPGTPKRTLSSGSLGPRSQRLPGQLAPSIATQSLQDLPSTMIEHIIKKDHVTPAPMEMESRQTHRIRCFLLWNLAFTYDIYPELLRAYITDDCVTSDFYDLSNADFSYFYALGQCLQHAWERVRQNQISLLIADDRSRITKDVIIPAKILKIEPEYLCEQLMSFSDHQFKPEKRHKSVLYSHASRSLFNRRSLFRYTYEWNGEKAQTHLAECLVSDDCVISEIARTEQIQVMFGKYIADFSNKHCEQGMGSVVRKTHPQPQTRKLLLEVTLRKRVTQQTNMRNVPSQISSRYKSLSSSFQWRQSLASQRNMFYTPPTTCKEEEENGDGSPE